MTEQHLQRYITVALAHEAHTAADSQLLFVHALVMTGKDKEDITNVVRTQKEDVAKMMDVRDVVHFSVLTTDEYKRVREHLPQSVKSTEELHALFDEYNVPFDFKEISERNEGDKLVG